MESWSARAPAPVPPDLRPIAQAARSEDATALRRALDEARAKLVPSAGPRSVDPGSRAVRTTLVDSVVVELFRAQVTGGASAGGGFAVLAVGGYGRRELAPRSDVDLLLVRRDSADPAALEPFLRALWDGGLEVGSAVRTIAQAEAALASDLHAATALVQGRFLAGERELFAELRRLVLERFLPANAGRFLRAKIDETAERHAKRGGTIFLLAPDLKEGRGMLRDLELARLLATVTATPTSEASDAASLERDDLVLPALARADAALARWLDGASSGAEPGSPPERVRALARAEALLAATRAAVHELEPESKDRLGRTVQELAAERFGYKDRAGRLGAENFLRDVFLAAKTVDRTLRLARERALRALEPSRATSARAQRLGPGISASGSEVLLEPGALEGPGGLRRAIEVFAVAQRTKRDVALETREAVRRALSPERRDDAELERFRQDPEVARAFRELLGAGTHVAATLRALQDSGLLGELLPEFGALDGLAQGDTYHAYTVDEHTLAAIAALEGEPAAPDGGLVAALAAPEREDRIREELLFATKRRDLLRLGLLLHDAGKTGGALGHVERGVALVPDVARRLGLSLEEERLVRFLVEHHLTLSSLVEKRDVDAPETRAELLKACDHEVERLDQLYLLTCADVRAVSPRAFTRWKDTLLTRLYESCHAALAFEEPHAPRPSTTAEIVRDLTPLLPAGVTPEQLTAHLELCPRPYLVEVAPDEVLLHLELARAVETGRKLALRAHAEDGFDRVYVATRDRPRLFAALCGALAAEGLNIVAASAYTRRDGVVLDRFAVASELVVESQGAGTDRWAQLERTLDRVLSGEDPAALVRARARRLSAEPEVKGTRRPPLRVRLSNKISPQTTVVDVSAPDRLGLLHDLARALADLGLDIRLAKIATKGDRAVDVFYVTTTAGEKIKGAAALAKLRRAIEGAARGEATPDLFVG